MPDPAVPGVLRQLRRTLGRADGGAPDAQLLERFLARRDEDAFELLVWRHERLVLSVCRRILDDAHDAEDAFQATFLTLVRKAGSISRRQAVASWLYKVACRIALRARAGRSGVARREKQGLDLSGVPAATDGADAERRELGPLLDEEISRLPEKYRAPIVLCYLEGRTYEEAACRLGCPLGTVSTRLTRARERLRGRLARRGVGLGAAALAAVLCERAASAAVPAALVDATVKAAAGVAAGRAAVAVASARVAALTEGQVWAMFIAKLKVVAALLLALGLLGGGAVLLAPGTPAARGDGEKKAPAAGKPPRTDQERLQGTWVPVSINAKNKEATAEELRTMRILFADDRMTLKRPSGRDEEYRYQIDSAQKPKSIDLRGKAVGIYELAGGNLRLCLTDDEEPRPTDFKPGKRRLVLVLKRAKGGVQPAPKPGPGDGAAAPRTDKERLQGVWASVSINVKGRDVPAEQARALRITFVGDRIKSKRPLGDGDELPYRLDPTARPKAIDFGTGPRHEVGIYEFEGEQLRLCMSDVVATRRPADFKPGPNRTVIVLKRAGPPTKADEEAMLRLEVKALREALALMKASYQTLQADLVRQSTALAQRDRQLEGVLTRVDVANNTISLTLGKTKLALNGVPLSVRAKYFVGAREATINDLKVGMAVTLRLEDNSDRSEVARVEAMAAGKQ